MLGAVAVGALLIAGPRGPRWGMATVRLMAALTALGALSIAWSYLPDSSWLAAGQAVAYLAAFAGARLRGPPRAGPLAGAAGRRRDRDDRPLRLVAAGQGVPLDARLDEHVSGRLQAPFGYWNAIGLCAAIGLPACLWAGARRDRGRLVAGLAAPALSLMVSVDVLSYSRSADAAAALAVALWLAFAPAAAALDRDAGDRRRRWRRDQRVDAQPRGAEGRRRHASQPRTTPATRSGS